MGTRTINGITTQTAERVSNADGTKSYPAGSDMANKILAERAGGSSGGSSGGGSSGGGSSGSSVINIDSNPGQALTPGTVYTYKGQTYTQPGAALTPTIVTTPQTQISSANLQVGSTGQSVKDLQTQLGITADGIFGPQTQAAVKAYQTANGLVSDGIVGTNTAGKMNGGYVAPSNILPTDTLGNNPKVTIPDPTVTDTSSALAGLSAANQARLDAQLALQNQSNTNDNNNLKAMFDSLGVQPSGEQAYINTFGQPISAEAYKTMQNKSDELTAQLDSITKGAQVAMTTLESQAGGKGVTSTFLGRQQQEISRQAVIQGLPISAELNAVNGRLNTATQNLNKLFDIRKEDATNAYNYKKDVYTAFYNVAAASEKTKLDLSMKALDNQYAETQAMIADAGVYAKMAFDNGQSNLGSQIMSLDATSSTYKQDLARLQSQLKDPTQALDLQLKQLQIKKAQQDLSPSGGKLTKVTINGVDYMQDENGNLTTPNLPTSSENKDLPLLLEKGANDIKTIADLQLDNVSIGASAGNFQYEKIPFSKKIQDWQANLGNVLSGLTLAELARVKGTGVTFGALSEGERKAVSEAASALNQAKVMKGKGESAEWNGHFNASEKFVKEKLAEIQSYAELDFKKRTGVSYQDYVSGNSQTEAQRADDYIINDVGTAIQTSGGGMFGNYQ